MQSFFISLFEFCHGSQANPAYRDSVYSDAGVYLVALTLLTVLGYYYGLNMASARYARTKHWFAGAVLNAFLNFMAVLLVERSVPDLAELTPPSLSLAAIAGAYGLVAYVLLSFAVKWGSRNARRTPF